MISTLAKPEADNTDLRGRVGLNLLRVRFTLFTHTEMHLGDFPGTTIRSALAKAFRQMVCITKLESCARCPLASTCDYPSLFESTTSFRGEKGMKGFSDAPNPYVLHLLEPERDRVGAGGLYSFDLYVIGGAVQHLVKLVFAMLRLQDTGMSKGWKQGKGRFTLARVTYLGGEAETVLYEHGKEVRSVTPEPVPIQRYVPSLEGKGKDSVRLFLDSPLRMSIHRKWLKPSALTMVHILMAIRRRIEILSRIYGQGCEVDWEHMERIASRLTMSDSRLTWYSQRRYSSRQKQEMAMGGIVGSIKLSGEGLWDMVPLLQLGQVLHIGKGTTMGLGGISLSV